MDKLTYLAELAEGLARWVPERERQDILRYYAEYFEEAGPEREAEVVRELGDPWALSSRLAVEGGYVTQEQADGWRPPKKKKWPYVLAICVVVVVALIGSLLTAMIALGRYLWRNNVAQTPSQIQGIVEEGTGIDRFEGTYHGVVDGEEYTGNFWSNEYGDLGTFESIDADISFGDITVFDGDDYSLSIWQEGDLGGYELKWEIKGGVLKIWDAKSGGFNMGFGGLTGKHSLDVTITVPDGTVLEKVDVKTDLGDVFLSNVYAAEKIEAKTALGDVECYDVRAPKKLTLKSDLGDVTLGMEELYSGVDIDLETNLGQVEANLGCSELDCEYELKCSLGTVTVNGRNQGDKAERKGSYSYKLDAESDLGDVNVYFTQD
ncbi:MAG: DUF4097 family beta strand repeat-containing protein [Oscillospiraceae bacterium]|nr:DUF4097 family beta strand repeat-containing protein [Oscillospiraceae bacterium]